MEKKNSLQGSSNLQANAPGEHSDHGEAPYEQEESGKPQEGRNLRDLFKHANPTNGAVAVETKRKKSATLLGHWKNGDAAAVKKLQEPAAAAAVVEVIVDNNGDHPDSPDQPESSAPPPEEGTDTDVLTDSEMAGDKAPTGAGGGAQGVEDADEPRRLVPRQMRDFCVVRTREPAEDGTGLGDFGREDMMEMEDIKDCRVSLEEDCRPSRDEKRRSGHSQHKW